MDDILLLADTIFNILTDIFNLYTSTFIFSGVLALWLLRKAIKAYHHL